MRVTTGKYKGRRLKFVSDAFLRPTMDKVRKAVFDIIGSSIEGANFLDLFSGTGAVGIEALSRGAQDVCFIEKSKRNTEVTIENLKNLEIPFELNRPKHLQTIPYLEKSAKRASKVFCCPADNFLKSKAGIPFDIIYLDPPYEDDILNYLSLIQNCDSLNKDGIVISETGKILDKAPGFQLLKQKKYGDKHISICALS